ncbi:PREDICTED: probable plastid-lipid-associated protein 10, chloroplastic isoform X2 [Tarenaya hassleriana]|uniref:probable plastid-lipid-associated protein 10, chloroplastic isoform X2 n=1 Tax=Tarenaya hassleriana TaxID=28532 RepID=UPI00053C6FA1|nr:PREDICTED: probable plastid-lipid-associated protein 10, chloroplastic isoform X2 [Tarenaya hassleriana]
MALLRPFCEGMDLMASATFSSASMAKRDVRGINPFCLNPNAHQRRRSSWPVAVASGTNARVYNTELDLEYKKHDLLRAVQDTQRGISADSDQRSFIEEAMVIVESYNGGGEPIDMVQLDGTWRLQYTSAPDVLVLFEAASRLPFFQVGQIFQKFECRDLSDRGIVRNVVRWSVPNLLEEQEGATLVVSAKFDKVSTRNIYLQFEEILQFLLNFKAQIPVTATSPGRRSVGGLYYLSYLDNNMLLGRAVGGGGVFIFTRSQPLEF